MQSATKRNRVEPDARSGAGTGYDRSVLDLWMQCMEDYGQVWREDFGRTFFSQEYWYLFVVALVRYWRQEPLNVGDACATMRTGSAKTRETRLKRLVDEGWFSKRKNAPDLRVTFIVPKPALLALGQRHLRNSLARVTAPLAEGNLVSAQGESAVKRLEVGVGGEVPRLLLAWAEFLVGYTNDWNETFRNRFHTEEYWYPFVYSLRGDWSGHPLTMSDACGVMRTGSIRTREARIGIAVTRGLLERRKSETDHRKILILPTPLLEASLVEHFSRTLTQVRGLLAEYC